MQQEGTQGSAPTDLLALRVEPVNGLVERFRSTGDIENYKNPPNPVQLGSE